MPTASEPRILSLPLDEHTCGLAAEALRGEADRRRRAGIKLSGELADAKRGGADIRTGAMQVVNVLAEADALAAAAEGLDAAWEAGKPAKRGRRRSSAAASADPLPSAEPAAPSGGDDDDESEDDELDEDTVRQEGGATVLDHGTDPDVAAAVALLGGSAPPPAAVAPAAPTLPVAQPG